MTWEILIPLIARYGPEWVYEFTKIVSTSATPTPEQWTALLALSQKPLTDYVKEAETRKSLETPTPAPTSPGTSA